MNSRQRPGGVVLPPPVYRPAALSPAAQPARFPRPKNSFTAQRTARVSAPVLPARGNPVLPRGVVPRPPAAALPVIRRQGPAVLPSLLPARGLAPPRLVLQRGTLQRMEEGRYPQRTHHSPQEAQLLREAQAAAERKAYEARQALQEQYAESARQQRLLQPPTTHGDRTFLDSYAINIHQAYDWQGKDTNATTAIGILENDTTGHTRYQIAPQRAMNDMKVYAETNYGTIVNANHFTSSTPASSHIHAEMWLLYWATEQGYTLKRIGVSKMICPNCQYVLNKAGVAYDSSWADDKTRLEWKDPWEYFGKKNPYL